MSTFKAIVKYFDRLERKVRSFLSHWPLFYALLGSIGIVLIWRGIWIIADDLSIPGWVSALLGTFISMFVGLFVSFFVGDKIIISGLKHEKRVDEKTEEEIRLEELSIRQIKEHLNKEDAVSLMTEKEVREEQETLAEIKEELKEIREELKK